MDFLILHEYFAKYTKGGAEPSPAAMLNYGCMPGDPSPNCGPAAMARQVAADTRQHVPGRPRPLPIMVTEYSMEQP